MGDPFPVRAPLPLGQLPAWGKDQLPEPLPFTLRNTLRTIGPGAILLAASIGGGEWLVGPAITAQYGTGVLWVATLSIALQLVFNLEGIRYTLYSGEPILSGIMRLWPGSKLWAAVFVMLAVAQLGVPALAKGCATPIFAAFAGRLPLEGNAGDARTILWITYGVILSGVVILLSGKTIERTLEWASWGMIVFIVLFLLAVNVAYVPLPHWLTTIEGFFSFGYRPAGVDFVLLATFAATAGSGGLGNLVISNWARDKGFGMGARVGAIRSALASDEGGLSHVGKVFPITSDNMRRWRLWNRYVSIDQIFLWALGCFFGMYLNVNLVSYMAAPGTDLTKIGAGAFQAEYLAAKAGQWLWILTLVNGFWILFSTHLGNTDTLVRTITDIIWVSSERLQRWKRGSSGLYYGLLALLTAWGMIAVQWGKTMELFKVLGIVACPVLALGALQIWRVNTTLLPPELRPGWFRRAGLAACSLFYGALSVGLAVKLVADLTTSK
jgi:hypothetical protein